MSRSYNPGVKLPLIIAGSPLGGVTEVAVSGDRRTYYLRHPGTDSYQRITLPVARVLVETMARDCDEVPERLRSLDERLVQELRNRTEAPDLPARGERSTNWSRRFTQETPTFTQPHP